MDPVFRRNATGESQSAQNVLGDQGDKGGVFGVVIKSVAAGELLDNETPCLIQQGSEVEFATAERPAKHVREILAERVCQQCGCIQHGPLSWRQGWYPFIRWLFGFRVSRRSGVKLF